MAVDGTIALLSPPGGEVEWNTSVVMPFGKDANGTKDSKSCHLHPNTESQRPVNGIVNGAAKGDAIQATAYNLSVAAGFLNERNIHYDDEVQRANGLVKVVIICTSKINKEHHVLLISGADAGRNSAIWERVGVARLPDTCIDRKSGIRIAVI